MIETVLAQTTTELALLPSFLDPVNLLNSFGGWILGGLLLVVFIESGLLFPLLPGDSLLFTAGLIVAAKSAEVEPFAPLWVLLVTIPIAAFLGDQVGYFIGNKLGYLEAVVEVGVKHPQLGEDFKAYLKEFIKTL